MDEGKSPGHRSRYRRTVAGVFLRYSGAAYIDECWQGLQLGAQHYGYELREVEATPQIISNIVPWALQDGAESWLIVYRKDRESELLVLPYPDNEMLRRLPRGLHRHASDTLEIIRGSPEKRWYCEKGYSNLRRNLDPKKPSLPRLEIHRFQVARTGVSLDSLLRPHQVRRIPLEKQASRNLLQEASTRTQRHRRNTLSLILVTDDTEHRQELLAGLENRLLAENLRVYERIQSDWDRRIMVPLVRSFAEVLDEETRRFLISAETVQQFARKNLPDDFDYSLPGSGLWKAVERELNLSLVWYLRHELGIAEVDDPWTAIKGRSRSEDRIETGGRSVDLNRRESKDSSQLRGVMLGSIEYMLRWAYRNGVHGKLQLLLENEPCCEQMLIYLLGPFDKREKESGTLPWFLEQVRSLRNRHAHIVAMSPEQFQQLHDLILSPETDPPESGLGKILKLKQRVLEHWAS